MEELVSVKISKSHHELLQKLCKRDDIHFLKDYIAKMVEYFDETGLEPTQKVKSATGEISKLRNMMVGFIREQEKTKIDPMVNQFNELTEFLINHFKTQALTKEDLKNYMLSNRNTNSPIVESSLISREEPKKEEVILAPSLEDSIYRQKLNRAKGYFKEFCKHFKPSTFSGGFTIEKKTVKHYEELFDQLN